MYHLSGAICLVFVLHFYFMGVGGVCTLHDATNMSKPEDNLWDQQLSTMWAPGIKFRSAGVMPKTFTHRVTSLTLHLAFGDRVSHWALSLA